MTTKVAVNSDVLQWALDRSDMSVAELLPIFPKLKEWLRGLSQPTIHQLEKFAHATFTPFGQMFLDAPPDDILPIPHYRTTTDEDVINASPDLIASVLSMQWRQDWMRDFVVREGQDAVPLVNSARSGESYKVIAQRMREMLSLDEDWASRHLTWTDALRALRESIESAGVMVVINGVVGNNVYRKLDPIEFRGFVLVDAHAPLIFVNGADWKSAQMFTLAHEIAHLAFGSSAAFDLRRLLPASDGIEQKCNQVAAEFLVPESRLRLLWQSAIADSNPFQSLARRFKVSEIVVARRAFDLGLITESQFFSFYRKCAADERRKSKKDDDGGGDFYALQGMRIGHRFASAVFRAVREGKLLYSDAYSLTGIRGTTFEKFASAFV